MTEEGEDDLVVCSERGDFICAPSGATFGEVIDNARLIAASPDLLAALVDCAECLKRLPDVDGAYRATCLNQASAAINLAIGQKP